ncbi:MAG: 16S rRNA (guanine(527)-N(7))-methyltransferase RsmG [Gammaproteobacteria bacterium]|nr:16S rRNA (guanine(527)-N(7))-methyltransferase RsmG [Gammaproteobacteria bacterium]
MNAQLNQSPDLATPLAEGIHALGLTLNIAQQQKLLDYIALLHKWNKVYNLTAIRDPREMVGLHILDSLALLPHLLPQMNGGTKMLDVGSGGGLPGICVSIAAPMLEITMIDSLQKKTAFIRQAIGELGLKNADVVCERIEKYQPTRQFNIITSRAFATLTDFVNGAKHLLASDGKFIAMKGVYPHDEIANIPKPYRVSDVIKLKVPCVEGERHLVVIASVGA